MNDETADFFNKLDREDADRKDREIKYNSETHEYTLKDKKVPSVTELASEFSHLNKEYFKAHPEYAARGTLVHEELADYYRGEKSFDALEFDVSKEIAPHLNPHKNLIVENIVYNTTLGYAGTADLILAKGLTVYYIIDIKTGRTRNRLYEQCQLSLYYLALQDMGYDVSGAQLFVMCPDGLVKYRPLTWEQMKQLDEGDLVVDDDTVAKIHRLTERLKFLKQSVDEYAEVEADLKDLLLRQFSEKDANTFVYNNYKFSYTKASIRKSVDTAALKKDGLYDKYLKETEVAPTVRITKRKDDDE